MYTLVRAIGKKKEEDGKWIEVSLGGIKCSVITNEYKSAWFVLSTPYLSKLQSISLETIRNLLTASADLTFNQWLASLGSTALETVPGEPKLKKAYLRVGDAWSANYRIIPTDNLVDPTTDLSPEQEHDLLLTKKGVNYENFRTHALVAVNGLIHQTNASINGLYITDAVDTATRLKNNHVTIFDFQDLGKLDFFSITKEMLKRPIEDLPYSDRVYLELPEDFAGKTVGVVIGGFLQFLDGSVQKVSDRVLSISINRLPWLERFKHYEKAFDLTTAPVRLLSDGRRLPEEIYSDEFIEWILLRSQSFVFLVDHQDLLAERVQLERTGIPGRYIAHSYPQGYLLCHDGLTPDYLVFEQAGQYVIATDALYDNRQSRDTVRSDGRVATTEQQDTRHRNQIASMSLVRIVGAKVTIG